MCVCAGGMRGRVRVWSGRLSIQTLPPLPTLPPPPPLPQSNWAYQQGHDVYVRSFYTTKVSGPAAACLAAFLFLRIPPRACPCLSPHAVAGCFPPAAAAAAVLSNFNYEIPSN